jgi:hypothetical protein
LLVPSSPFADSIPQSAYQPYSPFHPVSSLTRLCVPRILRQRQSEYACPLPSRRTAPLSPRPSEESYLHLEQVDIQDPTSGYLLPPGPKYPRHAHAYLDGHIPHLLPLSHRCRASRSASCNPGEAKANRRRTGRTHDDANPEGLNKPGKELLVGIIWTGHAHDDANPKGLNQPGKELPVGMIGRLQLGSP